MNVSFKPLRLDAVVYLTTRTGVDFAHTDFRNEDQWFCCTIRDDDGEVAAVIVAEFKTWFDAHVSTCVNNKRALSRRVLTACFRALFSRARRLTALIDPTNGDALKQVARMGFVQEGYLRFGIEGSRDAVLFGLIPEQCPYLAGRPFRWRHLMITHEMPEARM